VFVCSLACICACVGPVARHASLAFVMVSVRGSRRSQHSSRLKHTGSTKAKQRKVREAKLQKAQQASIGKQADRMSALLPSSSSEPRSQSRPVTLARSPAQHWHTMPFSLQRVAQVHARHAKAWVSVQLGLAPHANVSCAEHHLSGGAVRQVSCMCSNFRWFLCRL
jgi:hypothetical protein